MLIRRALLATTLAAITVLGTTACNMVNPVASQNTYAPSDGAQGEKGNIKARNLIFFVDTEGNSGLFGSIVNSGKNAESFVIGYRTPEGTLDYRNIKISAESALNFGYEGKAPLDFHVTAKAGDIVEVYLLTDIGPKVTINVPVMDATFSQYTDLVASLKN